MPGCCGDSEENRRGHGGVGPGQTNDDGYQIGKRTISYTVHPRLSDVRNRNRFLRYAPFTLFSLRGLLDFAYCVSEKRPLACL